MVVNAVEAMDYTHGPDEPVKPVDSLREPTVEELQQQILDDFDVLMDGVAPFEMGPVRVAAGATFRDRRTGGEARIVHDFMPSYHGRHHYEAGERWVINGQTVAERINGNGGWHINVEPTHLAGFEGYLQYLEENGERYRETGLSSNGGGNGGSGAGSVEQSAT